MSRANPAPLAIRPSDIQAFTGISRSAAYKLLKSDPTFPKLRQLSPGSVGWLAVDLYAWLESRPVVGSGRAEK